MIILIPLPLFFASTVYGVAGFSGKWSDYCASDISNSNRLTCAFFCSLGDCGNDLDVLLIVHSGLVSALGIQDGSYSDHQRSRQGTVFPIIAVCDHTVEAPLFPLFGRLGHLFSWKRKVYGAYRIVQVMK